MHELLWADRKRIFGLPISFTRYFLYEDKLIHSQGIFMVSEGEMQLYRILDVEIRYSLLDKILGVGTIILFAADVSNNKFYIQKVKKPREVLDMINELVDNERQRLGLKGRELFGSVSAGPHGAHQ